MATHPAFGLPKQLYCDNGSEYLFADNLKDALALNVGIHALTDQSGREVIRALPYNAAAKPIEGWFGRFEQHYLQTCQGYIGDDRMKPMNPKLGKLPTPFEGGAKAFQKHFFQLLKSYEWMPQKGHLNGDAPAQAFQNFVNAGWAATVINPEELLTVFTKPETRAVEKHGIRVDSRVWTGPDLDRYFGRKVTVLIPQRHGFNELKILNPDTGEAIGIVTPDVEYAYNDQRGAVRSAQRKADRNKAIRELDKSAPEIDVGARIIAFVERRGEVVPNQPSGVISINRNGLIARVITPEVIEHETEMASRRQAEAKSAVMAGLDKFNKKKAAQ
jgi:Mu transposase, C-terminal